MMGEHLDALRSKELIQLEERLEDALRLIRSRKVSDHCFDTYNSIGLSRPLH